MRLRGSLFLTVLALVFPAIADDHHRDRLQVVEATIADIQHQFRSGDLTPEDLVKMYVARIAAYDQPGPQAKIPQTLNSFMHVNENAVADARALNLDDFDGEDSEDEDGPRKPLFGIPVILKDNIDTADLPTTAGSVALGGSFPQHDAFITAKLRRAGAIIIGKATLTEFANFLSSTGMPTGYSSQLRFQLIQVGGNPALLGARIAVPHFGYWTAATGSNPHVQSVVLSLEQQKVMNDAIAVLRKEGAIVEDFHEIPDQDDLIDFPGCPSSLPACSTVLLFGFKRDLNAYLANLPPGFPVRTLADVIAFNSAHADVALKYGQGLALAAQKLDTTPGSADTDKYQQDRLKDLDIARTRGLDVVYRDFDAILFPANRGANIAARAGFPSIAVPGGFVPNPAVPPPPFTVTPFPAGFDAKDAPYAVTL